MNPWRPRRHPPEYLPALAFDRLTPLYDSVLRRLFDERAMKARLIDLAGVEAGHRVLDLGCGTGTMTVMVAAACPAAVVVGIDGDPSVLTLARARVRRSGTPVALYQGFAQALPFADASCDRVVSSLVFHHLTRPAKLAAAAEVARVLAPGGRLAMLDFGPPLDRRAQAMAKLLRHFEQVADNLDGLVVPTLEAAGLDDVVIRESRTSPLGTLAYYIAHRAG